MTTNNLMRIPARTMMQFPEFRVHFVDSYRTKESYTIRCATDCLVDALTTTVQSFENKLQPPLFGIDNGTELVIHMKEGVSGFIELAKSLEEHELDFIFAMRNGRGLTDKFLKKITKELANNCAVMSYRRHFDSLEL